MYRETIAYTKPHLHGHSASNCRGTQHPLCPDMGRLQDALNCNSLSRTDTDTGTHRDCSGPHWMKMFVLSAAHCASPAARCTTNTFRSNLVDSKRINFFSLFFLILFFFFMKMRPGKIYETPHKTVIFMCANRIDRIACIIMHFALCVVQHTHTHTRNRAIFVSSCLYGRPRPRWRLTFLSRRIIVGFSHFVIGFWLRFACLLACWLLSYVLWAAINK